MHTAIACDDSDACTTDSCDPVTGCVYTPIACDDDDACTDDACDPATGCTHAPTDCDDGDSCTLDACDSDTGCTHTWICNPAIDVEKVADVQEYDAAGDVITYTVTVTNTGETILYDVVLSDPMTSMNETIAVMPVGAVQTFTTAYVVTEADLEVAQLANVVTASARVPNNIVVDDAATSIVPRKEPGCCEGFELFTWANLFLGLLTLLALLILSLFLGGEEGFDGKFPLGG